MRKKSDGEQISQGEQKKNEEVGLYRPIKTKVKISKSPLSFSEVNDNGKWKSEVSAITILNQRQLCDPRSNVR